MTREEFYQKYKRCTIDFDNNRTYLQYCNLIKLFESEEFKNKTGKKWEIDNLTSNKEGNYISVVIIESSLINDIALDLDKYHFTFSEFMEDYFRISLQKIIFKIDDYSNLNEKLENYILEINNYQLNINDFVIKAYCNKETLINISRVVYSYLNTLPSIYENKFQLKEYICKNGTKISINIDELVAKDTLIIKY